MDDLPRIVGERLRAARRERGLSVGALADAAGVGKGSLSEIENGTRNPTLGTLYSLAGARLLDASSEAGQSVEVYRLRLEPGTVHRSVAHGPGVVEHLLVTSGRARAGRVGEEIEIGPGGAACWVSDVEHTYAALGAAPAESVLVIRSPGVIPAGAP